MKRKISIIILIVMLCNAILPRYCFAKADSDESMNEVEGSFTVDSFNSINDDGSASVRGDTNTYTEIKQTQSMKQTIVVFIAVIFDMLPIAVHTLMSIITVDGYTPTEEGSKIYFTIESLVRNQRPMFNANYFNFNTTSKTNNIFKSSVATWYYTIRSLAIIMSLLVLIYIGIRMAMSTVAIDKAKYKKMLLAWLESALIIWLIPYILSFSMALSGNLLELINKISSGSFEITIIKKFYESIVNSDYSIILWSIAFWLLIWYQLKFFISYAKRFLSIGFLIIISPLISVTYAIDKIDDGRAQGVTTLIKELLVNIFIQPLHAIIFVIFIFTANEIAEIAPVFAIMFIAALSRVEKIVKNIFNMRGLTSIHSLGAILPMKKKK